jgi:hypothetical protein
VAELGVFVSLYFMSYNVITCQKYYLNFYIDSDMSSLEVWIVSVDWAVSITAFYKWSKIAPRKKTRRKAIKLQINRSLVDMGIASARRQLEWFERSKDWAGLPAGWRAEELLGSCEHGTCGLFSYWGRTKTPARYMVVKQGLHKALVKESKYRRKFAARDSQHIV